MFVLNQSHSISISFIFQKQPLKQVFNILKLILHPLTHFLILINEFFFKLLFNFLIGFYYTCFLLFLHFLVFWWFLIGNVLFYFCTSLIILSLFIYFNWTRRKLQNFLLSFFIRCIWTILNHWNLRIAFWCRQLRTCFLMLLHGFLSFFSKMTRNSIH